MLNIPNTEEWPTFASTPELTQKADTVASIVAHLLSFETRLCRAHGFAPDAALFIRNKYRGRHLKDEKGNDKKGDD